MNRRCYVLILLLFIFLPSGRAGVNDEDCTPTQLAPDETTEFIESLEKICEALYLDFINLKVNHDGQGTLGVHFEDQNPKILILTYKNGSGTVRRQITFDELSSGKALEYENPTVPGNAIIVKRGDTFDEKMGYKFQLKFRSEVSPDKYKIYNIDFNSSVTDPAVSFDGKRFNNLVLSPGVSFFSWNGTFKKVEFR